MPRSVLWICIVVLLVISLPYLLAAWLAAPEAHFGGFLFNLTDGYSYLAKMHQGWQGSWLFRLPYTAEPGPGSYLNLFYLFLGHAARVLGLSLPVMYHLARLLAAAALLALIWRLVRLALPHPALQAWAMAFSTLGLGLGWLVFPTGIAFADFWVAEAFPILTMYSSPHFSLGLALVVWLLTPAAEGATPRSLLAAALVGWLLSAVSPFGLLLAAVMMGAWWLVEVLTSYRSAPPAILPGAGRRLRLPDGLHWRVWPGALAWRLAVMCLAGAPLALYYLWVAGVHPMLRVWNAQNLTLTPAVWDVALSLSPALLLAAWGLRPAWRSGAAHARLLVVWLLVGLAFIYLPFSLQRRFMIGLYIPAALLAAWALANWLERYPARVRRLRLLVFSLALPTLILVLLAGVVSAAMGDPRVVISRDQRQALDWLQANAAPDALVLAAPDSGLLIPAFAGQRVLYGHEYETINAQAERQTVTQFFTGDGPPAAELLQQRGVDYIFYGPNEQALGPLPDGLVLEGVFETPTVSIYRLLLGEN